MFEMLSPSQPKEYITRRKAKRKVMRAQKIAAMSKEEIKEFRDPYGKRQGVAGQEPRTQAGDGRKAHEGIQGEKEGGRNQANEGTKQGRNREAEEEGG